MKIIRATIDDLDDLVMLFDKYRQFYKQESNIKGARHFLKERFHKNESVVFIAVDGDGNRIGFTQLYPIFSSVSMQPVYVLNDLYVAPDARNKGAGRALMKAAKDFAIETGCKGLTLETATDNPAQKLYRQLGWELDSAVNHYTWKVQV